MYVMSDLILIYEFPRFHEFLKLENEIGNITRQEAVSMVGQHSILSVTSEVYVLILPSDRYEFFLGV